MTPNARRRQAGFALVGVLLVVGLIASMSAAYLRHMMSNTHSRVATSSMQARVACEASLEYGRQALLAGQVLSATTLQPSGADAQLHFGMLTDSNRRSLKVEALTDTGLGSTVLIETEQVPIARSDHPDHLPTLASETVTSLLADASVPKLHFGGEKHVSHTDLEGLIIINKNSSLVLNDVVVKGAIVSQGVMNGGSFGDFSKAQAPLLIIDGNVRIEPGAFLPGVAVVLPDGEITTWDVDARVQISGDVAAHTVSIRCPGVLTGNLIAVAPLDLDADLERPGLGRAPKPWAAALDLGEAWDTRFIAFLPRYSTVAELSAISDYWGTP